MNRKHISVTQTIRHLIQLAAFILFPGLFAAVLSSLGDIVKAILRGGYSAAELLAQIVTVAVVFGITIFAGRFFCGYICGFGALQELIAFPAGKIMKRRKGIPAKVDRVLKLVKYAVLIFTAAVLWVFQLPVDAELSPWGVFGMLVSGNTDIMGKAVPTVGFILLIAILAGSFFVERFFCRYLCPLGAIFTLISKCRLFRIRRNSGSCVNCGMCSRRCSMGIDVPAKGAVKSGECINCMECIDSCPKSSLSAPVNQAVFGAAAAVVTCGLIQAGNAAADLIPDSFVSSAEAVAASAEETLKDGVYTGTGTGFRGPVTVQVTIADSRIEDVSVIDSSDDQSFLRKARTGVISDIIAAQSANVDAVSGATYSSEGIKEAVKEALNAAGGSYLTEAASESAAEITEGAKDGEAGTQEISEETQAAAEAVNSSDIIDLPDGTYEGIGTGFRGEIKAAVSVKDGRITDIEVLSYADDERFFEAAAGTVTEEIINEQKPDVDAVSGATFSSNGIMAAVADALNIDFENPNGTAPSGGGHRGGGRGGKKH